MPQHLESEEVVTKDFLRAELAELRAEFAELEGRLTVRLIAAMAVFTTVLGVLISVS